MMLRSLPLLALPLLPIAPAPAAAGAPPTRSAAAALDPLDLLPAGALVRVSAPGLSALAERGLEHPALRRLFDSEPGRLLLADARTTPEQALALGEAALGMPLLPALAALTANGAALGVTPRGGAQQPSLVLLLAARDADVAEELLEQVLERVGARAGFPRAFERPHASLAGAEVWRIGDELRVARRGALIALANDEGDLRESLGLAASAAVARATEESAARPRGDELLWVWLDRERLAAELGHTGRGAGLAKLAAANEAPPAHYLLGPGLSALGTAEELVLALRLAAGELDLRVQASGARLAAAVAPAATPAEIPAENDDLERGRSAPPAPALPASFGAADCATAVLFRDLAGIHAHRQELFPPEKGPALTAAMSQLALFFGGLDLGEEVLPALSPWLRLVAAPVAWEAGREPEIALPGAALLVDVRPAAGDAEEIGPRLVSAFQSLIGVIGVDRAQKGMDPMVLHVALEGAAEISYASFPKPRPGDGVDVQHNFVPACALVGDTFVLGTHVDVVRRVVRDLAAGRVNLVEPDVERLELFGPTLAAAVERNRDALVMNNVYEKGMTREEARAEIDGLHAVLAWIERARVSVRYPGGHALEVRATLSLGGAPAGGRTEGLR